MANEPKLITRYEWWRGDLENFVKDIYGIDWDGQAAMDYPSQDTYAKVSVIGTRNSIIEAMNWIDDEELMTFKYAKSIVKQFKAGEFEKRRDEWPEALPSLEFLLQWLCFQKHIPAGEYLITVWW